MELFLGSFLACFVVINCLPLDQQYVSYNQNPVIKSFREYLRIDTSVVHNLDYAVEFWRRQAEGANLTFQLLKPAGKPICVITLEGLDSSLPAVMLNSHMDVVTVQYKDWDFPPFAAIMDKNGDIYGRGAQDTKGLSIQQLETLKYFKKNNETLQRTIHMTLMPDEETGGFQGMIPFLTTSEFKNLNIGFALDEGIMAPGDIFPVYNVDRRPWQMVFKAHGIGGHGSSTPNSETAMEKISKLIDIIMAKREEQIAVQQSVDANAVGEYSTLNINVLKGGVATNVIPTEMDIVVDVRLATAVTPEHMFKEVTTWMETAGSNFSLTFLRKIDVAAATAVDDTNPFWLAMKAAAEEMSLTLETGVCPATSDMTYLRNIGIPALGFSPNSRTENRIHAANEYVNAGTLLKGIEIYSNIVRKIANVV